jgi:hypothetical protein
MMGKERGLDLQLDLEKPKNEVVSSKSESQQAKNIKVENRQDKAGICFCSTSLYFLTSFWISKRFIVNFFFSSLFSFF